MGFMSEQDAMNFLNGMCVVESQADVERFREQWKTATGFVKRNAPRIPPQVTLSHLPAVHAAYIEKLRSQPIFQQMFGPNPFLQAVEISALVSFQRHVDTQYGMELASKMNGNEQFLIESCLPLQFQQNIDITFDAAVPGATFSSFSPKLIIQAVHISGVPGQAITIGGQPAQPGVLVQVGSQPNYVQVVRYRDRYFLKNGYHRTYAALISGHKYIPAALCIFLLGCISGQNLRLHARC